MPKNNDIFEFLHGKTYTLDGVHGKFKYSVLSALYPYKHEREELSHEPSTKGKRSVAYKKEKRMLGDDWSTDLTNSIERYCEIAQELGYEYEYKENPQSVIKLKRRGKSAWFVTDRASGDHLGLVYRPAKQNYWRATRYGYTPSENESKSFDRRQDAINWIVYD